MNATIENLLIDETCSFTGTRAGALSFVTEGVVLRNVTNKATVMGKKLAGGFIGFVPGQQRAFLSFDACVNYGRITSSEANAGGFIGCVTSCSMVNITISNSVNNGLIGSRQNTGGFIGSVEKNNRDSGTMHTITILNTSNHGNVTSLSGNSGGFIGLIHNVTQFNVSFSGSSNTGWVGESVSAGGFLGYVHSSTGNISISNCQNYGNITATDQIGGFIGSVHECKDGNVVISNTINEGFVQGNENVGGLIGDFFSNRFTNLEISNVVNTADVSGNNSVGGFLGYVTNTKDANAMISNSRSTGNVFGNDYVGGLVGTWYGMKNMIIGLHHCVSSGFVGGNNSVGGFVGVLVPLDDDDNDVFFEITNSISSGTISASGAMACGLFCVDSSNRYYRPNVYNSISKVDIKANPNTFAYGIANLITNATNVVSMAKISGPSSAHLFWDKHYDESLFYGFNGSCPKCLTDDAKMFEMDESDGLYKLIESGESMDIVLNNQVSDGDAKWTFDLSLLKNYLSVVAGKPVNRRLFVDPVNPLDHLASFCQLFMGSCIIVDNETKNPITSSSSLKTSSVISFCYNVVVSGVISQSYYVEVDTQMKDLEGLSSFFNEQYGVISVESGSRKVFNPTSVVNRSMDIMVVKKPRVTFGNPYNKTLFVYPGDSVGQIEKEHGLQLDDFILVVKDTEKKLTKSSVIEADVDLDLFCNVTFSGVFTSSLIVKFGNNLGDVQELQPFWNNNYVLFNPENENEVYTSKTSVLHSMKIVVVKNTRVVIEIDPVDDVNITDIISNITDIANVDPDQIIVDVVRNDDGQVTEITVIVRDEQTASTIVDVINSIDTDNGCGAGVLCRKKRVYVVVELSCGPFPFVSLFAFLLAFFVHNLF